LEHNVKEVLLLRRISSYCWKANLCDRRPLGFLPRRIGSHAFHLETDFVHDVLDGTGRLASQAQRLESVHGQRTRFWNLGFVRASARQLVHGHTTALDHGLFGLADPDTRIIELLVGLVRTGGITNLTLQVFTIFRFKFTQAVPVRPLRAKDKKMG